MIPGRLRVIYEASHAQQPSRSHVMLAPLISPRTKGLSVSLVF